MTNQKVKARSTEWAREVLKSRGHDPDEFGLEEEVAQEEELDAWQWFWLLAFRRLNSCRPVGMGVGPIPWTAIHQYALAEHMDSFGETVLEAIISRMDNVYLEHYAEEQERRMEEAKGSH